MAIVKWNENKTVVVSRQRRLPIWSGLPRVLHKKNIWFNLLCQYCLKIHFAAHQREVLARKQRRLNWKVSSAMNEKKKEFAQHFHEVRLRKSLIATFRNCTRERMRIILEMLFEMLKCFQWICCLRLATNSFRGGKYEDSIAIYNAAREIYFSFEISLTAIPTWFELENVIAIII